MSSNNLYNILKTLKNLEPKEAPKSTESKAIYESVEAKGSIMTGVAGIEKKLSEAYVAEKAKSPYAVGMAAAMKSTGDTPPLKKSTITKAHDIAKKVKEAAPHEKLPVDQLGLDKFAQAKLAAQPNKLKREKNKMVMQRTMQNPDMAEARPDVMRHKGDQTVKVVKKGGKPIGEIGIDAEASPGNGPYYVKLYDGSYDAVGFDTAAEALAELKTAMSESMAEGEVTKTSTGVRHRGSYGTEYQGDADEEEAVAAAAEKGPKKRGRPAKGMAKPKPAAGEKLGRGRPKKAAAPTYGGAKDLQSFFGSNPAKGKTKGTVHRMDEARIMDGANETLQHVLNRFKHEVKQFEQTGDLDNDLYEALFDYYMDSGDMPYGVAKGRTGDPYNWIADRVAADMGMNEATPVPATAPTAPAFNPGDRVMYMNKFATVVKCDGDACGIKVDGQSGTMMVPTGQIKKPSYDESMMEDDLNELARLAGLNVAEAAKPDYIDLDKDGDREESMKQAAKDAKDEQVNEEPNEGNEFSGELAAARKAGKKEFNVDGKTYPVKESDLEQSESRMDAIANSIKEAEQMLDMMRSAGLNTSRAEAALAEAKKYGDIAVEKAPEYANSPDEEIQNVDAIIHQGNDLNREKKQYADKPKAGDNPMATKESVDPLAALGNRLMRAYESIKVKVGK